MNLQPPSKMLSGLLIALALGLVHCQHAPEPTARTSGDSAASLAPGAAEPASPADKVTQASQPAKPVLTALSLLARQTWLTLPHSADRCNQSYDYFPEGGLYSFYCRIQLAPDFRPLEDALQMPIFLSGPHQFGKLDRTSETSFGHYNPDFVRTLSTWTVPAIQDDNFRRATQGTYNDYIQPLARIMWATWAKLRRNPDFWQQEQKSLQEFMTRKGSPNYSVENYFFFMHPDFIANADHDNPFWPEHGFDAGYNGNVTKSAVGFWIRRGIDGTADDFARTLEQMLVVYDPQTLREAEEEAQRGN